MTWLKKTISIVAVYTIFLGSLYAVSGLRIDEAYTARLIEKVKSFSENSLLKVNTSESKHCMTMILYEAKKNWERLTEDGKRFFKRMFDRPEGMTHFIETSSGYYTVWFDLSTIDQSDNNNNGIPDYVDNIAEALENVRSKNIEFGFTLPPPDNGEGGDDMYDVYLSNDAAGDGVYGYVAPEAYVYDNPNSPDVTETTSGTSHMVLRSDYQGFGEGAEGELNAMKVTVSHEFQHAIQFGYGGEIFDADQNRIETMDGFCMEGCATWAEDWIYPGLDDNLQYIPGRFWHPDFALNWNNDDLDDEEPQYGDFADWWYGGWLFFRYFSEFGNNGVQDANVIQRLYHETITDGYLNGINTIMNESHNGNIVDLLNHYYLSLAVMSDNAGLAPLIFGRANDYLTYINQFGFTGVVPDDEITFTGTEITWDTETDGDRMLMRLGADFIKLTSTQDCKITISPKENVGSSAYNMLLLTMNEEVTPTSYHWWASIDGGTNKSFTLTYNVQEPNHLIIIPTYFIEPALYNMQYILTITSTSTDIEDENQVPTEIVLHQNYPNPFNPSTTIRFSLPERMDVKVDVVDIKGAVVANVFDGVKSSGSHEIKFNANGLASGMYFTRMITKNGVLVNKMILMK